MPRINPVYSPTSAPQTREAWPAAESQTGSDDIFEGSCIPTIVNVETLSLRDLHKNLKNISRWSPELVLRFWRRLPLAKAASDDAQATRFGRFVSWLNPLTPEQYVMKSKYILLNDITRRFFACTTIDGLATMAATLDPEIVQYIAQDIVGVGQTRPGCVQQAVAYHNVKLSGLRHNPFFEQLFLIAMATKPFFSDHIRRFFDDAIDNDIDCLGLFRWLNHPNLRIDPRRRGLFIEQARRMGVHIDTPPPAQPAPQRPQAREPPRSRTRPASRGPHYQGRAQTEDQPSAPVLVDHSHEYNQMLKTAGVEPKYWYEAGKDAAMIRHGYRLAALKFHPDHGGSNESFQRFTTLFETVEALVQSS